MTPRVPSLRLPKITPALLAVAAVVAGGLSLAAPVTPAQATAGFTAGDLVVYRVGDGTAALSSTGGSAVFLDEFAPTGGAAATSLAMPTTVSGNNKPLVASGGASSEGELTLSPNGNYLALTGYDYQVGGSLVLSSSAAATTPRTVGIVDAGEDIDTSTALNDFADGNNPRSAVTTDGKSIWVGGAAGGVRYTTVGSTTSTMVTSSSCKNFRQVSIAGGQLYASADPTKSSSCSTSIATIGSGTPTSGSITPTPLTFSTAPSEPYGYSFLTLGTGTAPDTLYVADNSAGEVLKYGLLNGTWTTEGDVSVPGVTGVTANDVNGTAEIFATANGTDAADDGASIGELFSITDSSGAGGTLSGTASQIATSGDNEAFHGVAFAPGTTIGSGPGTGGGGGTKTSTPIIETSQADLPAAIEDPTNPSLGFSVEDTSGQFSPSQLTVTASSSNTSVGTVPATDIPVSSTGTGSLVVTPVGTVGYSTITLTVSAPDGGTSSTNITYGVSAYNGDPSQRYFSGSGNLSTAIDVGNGYMVVGDDENNVIREYKEDTSGPPVETFDFTSEFPYGTDSIDIEASARAGNMLYWSGSMGNNSSGDLEPSRSTLFGAQISGTAPNITLTYEGSYTGLQSDLVNWDEAGGSGLGANYLGLNASVNAHTINHADNALGLEGMEFIGNSTSAVYLAFRSPLEPTTNRHLALIVPLTNINALINGQGTNQTTTHATFGTPLFWNLGGLGVREIRENANGQYLIIAGTADASNSKYVLYQWDGNPAHDPLPSPTVLPLIPADSSGNTDYHGSWESIVSVPNSLTNNPPVQLIEDNGDTVWYGDTQTAKDTLPIDLQKDLSQVFTYQAPARAPSTTTGTSTDQTPVIGEQVTLEGTAAIGTYNEGTPTGTLTFSENNNPLSNCSDLPLDDNLSAQCQVSYQAAANHTITVTYSGDANYAPSTATIAEDVQLNSDSLAVASNAPAAVTGQPISLTATVSSPDSGPAPTGTVKFQSTVDSINEACASVPLTQSGTAVCQVPPGLPNGTYHILVSYSGDGNYVPSDNSTSEFVQTVSSASTTTSVSSSSTTPKAGESVTFAAVAAPISPGAGTPTGTVTFAVTAPGQPAVTCLGGDAEPLNDGQASCVVASGSLVGGATYTVAAAYSGDSSFNSSNGSSTYAVRKGATSTSLTSSASPSKTGKSVKFKAAVSPSGSAPGKPTGSVAFVIRSKSGKKISCSGGNSEALSSSGVATCKVAAGALSSTSSPYSVTATYLGSSSFATSSAQLKQKVTKS